MPITFCCDRSKAIVQRVWGQRGEGYLGGDVAHRILGNYVVHMGAGRTVGRARTKRWTSASAGPNMSVSAARNCNRHGNCKRSNKNSSGHRNLDICTKSEWLSHIDARSITKYLHVRWARLLQISSEQVQHTLHITFCGDRSKVIAQCVRGQRGGYLNTYLLFINGSAIMY